MIKQKPITSKANNIKLNDQTKANNIEN